MDKEPSRLGRRLGLAQAVGVALGAMIGAGVYVSMGEAAGTTGASLLLAVPLGALVATLNGLSSVELGVNDPRAGGAYEFARSLVHPLLGFVAGWLFLAAALTAGATYALTFAAYLQPLLPGIHPRLVGLVLVLLATTLNAVGVRPSARINLVLVIINIAILVTFIVLALPAYHPQHLQPFLVGGIVGLLQATALLFFAYTGYSRPVTIVEEIRNPRQTLPRAVVTALGLTTVLYLGVAWAALGVLGPAAMGQAAAPLRAVMVVAGRDVGATLLSVGALIATTSVLLTEIWGLSRLAFAMASNGDLPGWLGQLSEGNRIPRNAVLTAGGIIGLLMALVDLRPALEASSLGLLIYYGIMNLTALRLTPKQRLYPAIVSILGVTANVLVALSLPGSTLLAVAGVALVGLAYYYGLAHR